MGGITRRQMLKASAVAGGMVWAAPLVSSGTAWAGSSGGGANACACDGAVVYAKFAPGNSQTCQNQCLQPGDVTRYNFDCLVAAGVISVCDDVTTQENNASLAFLKGTSPLKLALKTTSDCYVTRCTEGFSKVYHWSTSFNAESYPDEPRDIPKGGGAPFYDTVHDFDDPATSKETSMFRTYKNGNSVGGPCKGAVAGVTEPSGELCGWTSHTAGPTPCSEPITGVFMTTDPTGKPLNFIEMELCITNTSKIPCAPVDCNDKNNPL